MATVDAAEKDRKGLPLWAWMSAIVVVFLGLLFMISKQKEPAIAVAPTLTAPSPGPAPMAVVPPPATPGAFPDLGTVHFDTDQATVTPDMQATLQRAVVVMKANPAAHLRLEGYTDSVGTEPHNLTLSQQRAAAVAQYLKDQGIEASRLTGAGFGEALPTNTNDTAAGKADNRRVELFAQP